MWKITIKSPTPNKVDLLFFTTEKYEIKDGIISFVDKFGKKQSWNKDYLISIEAMY